MSAVDESVGQGRVEEGLTKCFTFTRKQATE
jgi:hypothetical protein